MSTSSIDTKIISKLAEILDKSNLTELEIENEGCRICLTRDYASGQMPMMSMPNFAPMPMQVSTTQTSPTPVVAAPAEAAIVDYANHEGAIKSPMVGVIYLSPEPGAPNYVKVGDEIKAGDTVCLIEAMKTFNPVKAPKGGKVTKILVETGAPAEYGEPLIIVE